MRTLPTAPIAAAGMVAAWGAVSASGSRALGGAVLALFGLICVVISSSRDARRTTAFLVLIAAAAFALSHVLGLLIGAWPAVLVAAAVLAGACHRLSDAGRGDTAPQPSVGDGSGLPRSGAFP